MSPLTHRTKIVATIGPASDSPEKIKAMMRAGMSVARLNFSHGSYDDHAQRIQPTNATPSWCSGRSGRRNEPRTSAPDSKAHHPHEKGIPVITATQMLDSMIRNPRPTRAEVSDPHAISEALNAIDQVIDLRCIVTFTETGHSAKLAAAERPSVPVVAVTENYQVYHRLNLAWGVKPLLVDHLADTIDGMFQQIDHCLTERNLADRGDKVLIMGASPCIKPGLRTS